MAEKLRSGKWSASGFRSIIPSAVECFIAAHAVAKRRRARACCRYPDKTRTRAGRHVCTIHPVKFRGYTRLSHEHIGDGCGGSVRQDGAQCRSTTRTSTGNRPFRLIPSLSTGRMRCFSTPFSKGTLRLCEKHTLRWLKIPLSGVSFH